MSKSKKTEPKTFTSLDQLKAELFPDMEADADKLGDETKALDEADTLANKLIDDLISKANQQQ